MRKTSNTCNVKEAYWTEYTHFDLSVLGEAENWKEWFREEQRMWAMDGDPARYDSLLKEEIIEPVVILKRDDTYYVWDGNHRIGASLTKGEYLIKAIVGVPTAQLTPKKIKP